MTTASFFRLFSMGILLCGICTTPAWAQENMLYADSSYYVINPIAVNTDAADWGPFFHDGYLYFSSNRGKPRFSRFVNHIDQVTQKRFYTLYRSKVDFSNAQQSYEKVAPYAHELSGKYNVGPLYITPDGKTLIVTRNIEDRSSALKNKAAGYKQHTLQLFIHRYDERKKKWDKGLAFPYNSNRYNCVHAFLTPDGQRMYFSSDMPGTLGGMDIFVSERNGDTWSKPENLGPAVNSPFQEIFPSLNETGTLLFYSSDRPGGLGGLDIYRIELPLPKNETAQNVGYPVNSAYDDFGMMFYRKSSEAYFASNRVWHTGVNASDSSDNIYHVTSTLPERLHYIIAVKDSLTGLPVSVQLKYRCLSCLDQEEKAVVLEPGQRLEDALFYPGQTYVFTISRDGFDDYSVEKRMPETQRELTLSALLGSRLTGDVKDYNGRPVAGAEVVLRDENNREYRVQTDDHGRFVTPPFIGNHAAVVARYKELVSDTLPVSNPENPELRKPEYVVHLVLHMPERMTISTEIMFDYDKYTLTQKAKDTLDRLAGLLLEQPEVNVLLQGHTDSRGSDSYNMLLSLRRAQAVRHYLITKGIAPARLKAEGYGAARPVNKCIPGVQCTEEEHQQNRRVEFYFGDSRQKTLKIKK